MSTHLANHSWSWLTWEREASFSPAPLNLCPAGCKERAPRHCDGCSLILQSKANTPELTPRGWATSGIQDLSSPRLLHPGRLEFPLLAHFFFPAWIQHSPGAKADWDGQTWVSKKRAYESRFRLAQCSQDPGSEQGSEIGVEGWGCEHHLSQVRSHWAKYQAKAQACGRGWTSTSFSESNLGTSNAIGKGFSDNEDLRTPVLPSPASYQTTLLLSISLEDILLFQTSEHSFMLLSVPHAVPCLFMWLKPTLPSGISSVIISSKNNGSLLWTYVPSMWTQLRIVILRLMLPQTSCGCWWVCFPILTVGSLWIHVIHNTVWQTMCAEFMFSGRINLNMARENPGWRQAWWWV